MKALILSCLISVGCLIMYGQSTVEFQHMKNGPQPIAGKPMPDFMLDNITHFSKTKASLKDFKGKWLVLDFWFPECISCIQSFPKMDQLQRELGDQLQIVLVGQNGEYRYSAHGIQKMYERMQKKRKYILASAYDSILTYKWDIHAMPHIIIIDPTGIVRVRATSADVTKENLLRLFKGENVSFQKTDIERTLFEGGLGIDLARKDSDLIYRSILLRKQVDQEFGPSFDIDYQFKDTLNFKPGRRGYKAEGFTLLKLYNVAYFGQAYWIRRTDSLYGKVYPFPVLDIKDSTPFKFEPNNDEYYNYCLTVPPKFQSPEALMKIMQADLKNSFGYDVKFEKRKMPVWVLKASDGAKTKLRTKGGAPFASNAEEGNSLIYGFEWRNAPFKSFVTVLSTYLPEVKYMTPIPLFDETGIDEQIDISIDAIISDPEQVSKQLEKYNLQLVKSEKEFTVMVISEEL